MTLHVVDAALTVVKSRSTISSSIASSCTLMLAVELVRIERRDAMRLAVLQQVLDVLPDVVLAASQRPRRARARATTGTMSGAVTCSQTRRRPPTIARPRSRHSGRRGFPSGRHRFSANFFSSRLLAQSLYARPPARTPSTPRPRPCTLYLYRARFKCDVPALRPNDSNVDLVDKPA